MVNIWPEVIGDRAMATATTATEMSGDRSGNAADYTVPSGVHSILATEVYVGEVTPTAAENVFVTLRATSSDVIIGNYEVPGSPQGGILGATATTLTDPISTAQFKWFLNDQPQSGKQLGGAKIQFYGQTQDANTAAARAGAGIWLCDTPSAEKQYYALGTTVNTNSNNPTSTGTSAAAVVGNQFTISGSSAITIKEAWGMIESGTIVASDLAIGWYQLQAPEWSQSLRWPTDPVQGFLGTTGQTWNRVSRVTGLNFNNARMPTTVTPTLQLNVAPANAGEFEMGVLYQQ